MVDRTHLRRLLRALKAARHDIDVARTEAREASRRLHRATRDAHHAREDIERFVRSALSAH